MTCFEVMLKYFHQLATGVHTGIGRLMKPCRWLCMTLAHVTPCCAAQRYNESDLMKSAKTTQNPNPYSLSVHPNKNKIFRILRVFETLMFQDPMHNNAGLLCMCDTKYTGCNAQD